MKRLVLLIGLLICFLQQGFAQNINFSEHISPIIYNNCTKCHRAGEIGPFPLTNFTEVSDKGGTIAAVTAIRYMPPWKADPDFRHFLDERGLTDYEIQLIGDWVNAGKPQGDPAYEADLPYFPPGSQLGTPDLVLSMAEAYTIQGNGDDEYRVFVLPTGLKEDKNIAAVEFRAGNRSIVHHALIAVDTSGQAQIMASQDTSGYGFNSFGGFGVPTAENFEGYAPGMNARFYPEGIGKKIFAGSDLLIQLHYAPWPSPATDSSSVNIFFSDTPVNRFVTQYTMSPGDLVNGPFEIQPEEIRTFHGVLNVPVDVSLVSFAPHSHLLGKSWLVYAITATGDTINIVSVPEWDFNWQSFYAPEKIIKIPAGSQIHAYSTYDNTSNNPLNPNNPPELVTWGDGTEDEMFIFIIQFLLYEPGDENIALGDPVTGLANFAPGSFDLLAPQDSLVVDISSGSSADTLFLAWETSVDVNNDSLNYALSVTGDLGFLSTSAQPETKLAWTYAELLEAINQAGLASASGTWNVHARDAELSKISRNGPFSLTLTTGATGISGTGADVPKAFALHHNYPNPFNPKTTIRYDLPASVHVNISIYDLLGRKIRSLANQIQPAGYHDVEWDGTDEKGGLVGSGVYFYQIVTDDFSQVRKMILLQ